MNRYDHESLAPKHECSNEYRQAREIERLREALIRCAEISGEDGEAVEAARSGAIFYPTLEEWAIGCVSQLRRDYDDSLVDADDRWHNQIGCWCEQRSES